MRTTTHTPAPVSGLGWLFRWINRNPRSSSALLWLLFASIIVAAYYYRFTTTL